MSLVNEANSLDEFFEKTQSEVVGVRHFRSGKIDSHGNVVGVIEYGGELPHEHQDHFYDKCQRVIRLDKYERSFTKPTRRFYFYQGTGNKVLESVWFDRYGRIDNIHRYHYCPRTGLMTERAEYTRDGGQRYRILSSYDSMDSPDATLVQETWLDPSGNLIKRYEYQYDESAELVVERSFGPADRLIGYYTFAYDKRAELLEKVWHDASGTPMSRLCYEVDQQRRVIQTVLEGAQGEVKARQLFSYDEVGNVVEERWTDGDGQLMKQLRY